MTGFVEAAEALRRFGVTMQRIVDDESRTLAQEFARRHESRVVTIGWATHDNGDAGIFIHLANGQRLRGRAPGKLDALQDAANSLDKGLTKGL